VHAWARWVHEDGWSVVFRKIVPYSSLKGWFDEDEPVIGAAMCSQASRTSAVAPAARMKSAMYVASPVCP